MHIIILMFMLHRLAISATHGFTAAISLDTGLEISKDQVHRLARDLQGYNKGATAISQRICMGIPRLNDIN